MDVHEGTATVREAMRFSAYLRQPASVSKEEKDAYVEEMIELLELHDLSEALVPSWAFLSSPKNITVESGWRPLFYTWGVTVLQYYNAGRYDGTFEPENVLHR